MSATLTPWLSDAAATYQQSHRRNLGFTKKGKLLQITQYNNYRRSDASQDQALDVFAWAHDKIVHVLLRFDATAINVFERQHSSFTSYKGGLIHILKYRFVLGSDYCSTRPVQAISAFTDGEVTQPAIFYLHVLEFRYHSSKGEAPFAQPSLDFNSITKEWKDEIEADNERKRSLAQKRALSERYRNGPPKLEQLKAAAETMRSRKKNQASRPRATPVRPRRSMLNLNSSQEVIDHDAGVASSPAGSPLLSMEDGVTGQIEGRQSPANVTAVELPSTPSPPSPSIPSSSTPAAEHDAHGTSLAQMTEVDPEFFPIAGDNAPLLEAEIERYSSRKTDEADGEDGTLITDVDAAVIQEAPARLDSPPVAIVVPIERPSPVVDNHQSSAAIAGASLPPSVKRKAASRDKPSRKLPRYPMSSPELSIPVLDEQPVEIQQDEVADVDTTDDAHVTMTVDAHLHSSAQKDEQQISEHQASALHEQPKSSAISPGQSDEDVRTSLGPSQLSDAAEIISDDSDDNFEYIEQQGVQQVLRQASSGIPPTSHKKEESDLRAHGSILEPLLVAPSQRPATQPTEKESYVVETTHWYFTVSHMSGSTVQSLLDRVRQDRPVQSASCLRKSRARSTSECTATKVLDSYEGTMQLDLDGTQPSRQTHIPNQASARDDIDFNKDAPICSEAAEPHLSSPVAGRLVRRQTHLKQQLGSPGGTSKRSTEDNVADLLTGTGLTREQAIDLWYCCSGDLSVARALADPTHEASPQVYSSCWTYEDDIVAEATIINLSDVQEIEQRRGSGSVKSRRLFLRMDPLARSMVRRVRYPYDS